MVSAVNHVLQGARCDSCGAYVPIERLSAYDINPNHCSDSKHYCSVECYDEDTNQVR